MQPTTRIHEQVLEAANRITAERRDYTFTMAEIVRALPHLNENSVRTHVGSRCCVNAPKHHLHKWDYFRRIDRGRYEIRKKYRSTNPRSTSPNARSNRTETHAPTERTTIHVVIRDGGEAYVAECLEISVVSQGSTLDEVVENLRQAVALHLEDEDPATFGFIGAPRLQIVYDAPVAP